MYKTKLQELCHQKTWNLPEYSTTKVGQDHNPIFHATVIVNGYSFSSSSPSKSSKLAQNNAAKLAFDHFSSVSLPPVTAVSTSTKSSTNNNNNNSSNNSSGGTLRINIEETNQIPCIANNDGKLTDVQQHLYKNLLQSYAQKRGLPLPMYSCERQGPPHASLFKCKVTIDGKSYECLDFFPTVSKAEHAAAKAALTSLAPDGAEEDEFAYKNLLQELAQKEGYGLPSYSTVTFGESHKPTFASTVEVKGEFFTGQQTRTKKQAEFNAAKVAYKALKQRNSKQSSTVLLPSNTSHQPVGSCSGNSSQSLMASSLSNLKQRPITSLGNSRQSAQSLSPPHQKQKVVQFTSSSSRSDLAAYLKQNVQPRMPGRDKQAEEDREIAEVSSAPPTTSANVISCDPHIASAGPESCCKKNISLSPCPLISSLPDSAVSSSIEHPTGKNMLLHNKVTVHPRGTNMTYPPGSTVLPMSDDNWVAVQTLQSSQ
ncbi:double-stranded RNA-binding protein 1 [Ricinus communis]|uniref:double-stranded RNA-binding protein 1 n=1 Tax=Ricinus communis TaxID=3988 RepID=UPI00201AB84D|nr:double-stranded RNA-binding protein 1 [Ricinus communis]